MIGVKWVLLIFGALPLRKRFKWKKVLKVGNPEAASN